MQDAVLVRGAAVVELGCGLGVPSAAAAHAGATRILCVDIDAQVANSARRSTGIVLPTTGTGPIIRNRLLKIGFLIFR